jgi:outer membrane protein assembly factor BamB
MSEPVIVGENAYSFSGFGNESGWLFCADYKTGNVKWEEKTGNGSMVYVDGCLLCLTYSGDLFLIDPKPEGFKKITEWKGAIPRTSFKHSGSPGGDVGNTPRWTVPVVARGKLYLRSSDKLECYDLMR